MIPSSSKIRILSEQLINKIAAGEVVERPASIVKELIENSIDAGADQILITIKNGGKDLISILDNGQGMDENDARLAVERHATSKIATEDDLAQILTLGFRGEALASIAAVSEFELLTCHDEQQGATRLAIQGGNLGEISKTGFPKGTKITIQRLFFNTPARLKFMKTTPTEFRHIHDTVLHQALARPSIQFRLSHNQQLVFSLSKGQDLEQRIYQLFGDEFQDALIPVEHEETYLKYKGFLSLPTHLKGSKRWQYLFVNGRYVKCNAVNRAIYDSYRNLLGRNQHPVFFLTLDLDPSEIDVNVHPAKTEIRIRNNQLIHTILEDHLHRALMDASQRRHFSKPLLPQAVRGTAPRKESGLPKKSIPLQEQLEIPIQEKFNLETAVSRGNKTSKKLKKSASQSQSTSTTKKDSTVLEALEKIEKPSVAADLSSMVSDHRPSPSSDTRGAATLLGQWNQKYVVVEKQGSLVLIDQHAADEFRIYQQYKQEFQNGKIQAEPFLVPVLLELTPQNAILLEQYLPQFKKLGFDIESFGKTTYSIRKIPALLPEKYCKDTILAVLDELVLFGKSGRLEQVFNHVLEKVACYAALKQGDPLDPKSMESLMRQLENPAIYQFRPHGRAVCVELTESELDKRFKRL